MALPKLPDGDAETQMWALSLAERGMALTTLEASRYPKHWICVREAQFQGAVPHVL